MRFPEKYPELLSVFIEASTNSKSTFRDVEDVKKLKTIGAYTESSTGFIFKAFKQIIHLVTLPL
jgi:hypothetical protein